MTPSKVDPFLLLASRDDSGWPRNIDVLQAARDRFDPQNPQPLILLLEAEDEVVRARGLHLFGTLGRKAFVVLDQALKSVNHTSEYARSSLMDGVICHTDRLRPDQLAKILPLARDCGALVREKMIALIGALRLDLLEAAIALLDESLRQDHIKGLNYLVERSDNTQSLFENAISNVDVRSTYALASIERMAREGKIATAPEYTGDSYVPRAVVEHVKVFIARTLRKHNMGRA